VKVWVVVKQKDKGIIAGVFASLELASEYVANHPYDGFSIEECNVRVK
jgi:hypothetical protein